MYITQQHLVGKVAGYQCTSLLCLALQPAKECKSYSPLILGMDSSLVSLASAMHIGPQRSQAKTALPLLEHRLITRTLAPFSPARSWRTWASEMSTAQ